MLDDDFIEHFGTKGMRWGVRKVRSAGSRIQARRVANTKAAAKVDAKIFRKLGLKRMAKDAESVSKTGKAPMISPSLKKIINTKISKFNSPKGKLIVAGGSVIVGGLITKKALG